MLADAYLKWRELAPPHERHRMTSEEKLQLVIDKQRIVEMINEYAFACDSRSWDVLEELYDEDIERVMSGTPDETVRGRDTLIGLHARPTLPRAEDAEIEGPEIRHLIATQLVRIGNDNRKAWALCHYQMALAGRAGDAAERGLHEGTCLFSFAKTDGTWKFTRQLIWTDNAANPLFGVPKL